MKDVVVRAEGLGKRYRIGKIVEQRNGRNPLHRRVAAQFGYLRDSLREPNPNEIIWSLKDVSFEVERGEVLGIIGRNGAGKSTLLKILSRITEPTVGRAIINGRLGSLLEVGTGFHPELTGRENVYLSGAILGMKRAEIQKKFDEIVEFSGVGQFIETPAKRYSSGMYVRLAFAVAAHLDTEILLVDEVLAVGDAAFQRKCLSRMGEAATLGRTVLFVSHNMGAIRQLTHRCICLDHGRIVADGSPKSVTEHYLGSISLERIFDFTEAHRPRVGLGRRIRISWIEPRHPQVGAFYFGQDLVFEVKLESSLKRTGLRFGLTVADVSGSPILSSFTPNEIATPASGLVSATISMSDTGLAPGTYTLALSIGEGGKEESRRDYDIVNPGPVFTVASIAPDGGYVYRWNSSHGPIFHLNSRVESGLARSSAATQGNLST